MANRPRVLSALAVTTALGCGIIVGATAAAFAIARKVVTPVTRRLADTQVLSVDTRAQTITLRRTADTVLPGRYGLFVNGERDYLKIGALLTQTDTTATRKLLTEVAADEPIGRDATFSGWYYVHPSELHIPYREVDIPSPVGTCPAWLFPAKHGGDSTTWVINIHGRGTTRSETLRAAPAFREAGVTSLAISYRNDTEAPRSDSGKYGLGATEWRDVEAAIEFAVERGARRIVLMGWSMGGAIALQTSLRSAHAEMIDSIILDSPVVDWRTVLGYQARDPQLPGLIAENRAPVDNRRVEDDAVDHLGVG